MSPSTAYFSVQLRYMHEYMSKTFTAIDSRIERQARSGHERGAEKANRKNGWSVVMDDDNGSVGGRWLALAARASIMEEDIMVIGFLENRDDVDGVETLKVASGHDANRCRRCRWRSFSSQEAARGGAVNQQVDRCAEARGQQLQREWSSARRTGVAVDDAKARMANNISGKGGGAAMGEDDEQRHNPPGCRPTVQQREGSTTRRYHLRIPE
ncbi:hypothetical protein Syun_001184 [Stephania yunnanensis]|uniref:Uncharacterized protein n=1 Tax=Stephania yunnanensis TaxID=152371 RepID=A0AAP0Q7H8_9MAGN